MNRTKHRVILRRETVKVLGAATLTAVAGGQVRTDTNAQTTCPSEGDSDAFCSHAPTLPTWTGREECWV